MRVVSECDWFESRGGGVEWEGKVKGKVEKVVEEEKESVNGDGNVCLYVEWVVSVMDVGMYKECS